MDRGVKSCIYCHHNIDETTQRFHAIASSIKSWRGFIDIMMTEYTRFYSTIHLISKSASRFGHLNILKWLSLKIYKLSHFILSSIYNYTIYAIILTRPIYAIIQLTSKYPKSCFLYSFFMLVIPLLSILVHVCALFLGRVWILRNNDKHCGVFFPSTFDDY